VKGDFSRDTFDAFRHFSRVLLQQGRVALDADANEQSAILLRFLQQLAVDLIGPHAGPADHCGFEVRRSDAKGRLSDLALGAGRYYVDGILCENDRPDVTYRRQPDFPVDPDNELPSGLFLVYLDVWERHITWIEDDRIREVALGGPDTATRAKVVWQVKLDRSEELPCADREVLEPFWETRKQKWQPSNRGRLKARLGRSEDIPADLGADSARPRYNGAENQLYRVEIHRGNDPGPPTFKWSRDNGSVVFPIRKIEGSLVTLGSLGRDDRHALRAGEWVEVVIDSRVLHGEPGLLFRVAAVHIETMAVELEQRNSIDPPAIDETGPPFHPLLRRWDQRETEGGTALAADCEVELVEDEPLDLENGIQIIFDSASPDGNAPSYRTGDYWLIPARTATGDIEWPRDDEGKPLPEPPRGIEHHYAPLAIVAPDKENPLDLRRKFVPLAIAR
jgi:hypothetical protein